MWVHGAAVRREPLLARTSASQARRLGMRRREWCHVLHGPQMSLSRSAGARPGQAAAEFTLIATEETRGCPGSAKSLTVETNQRIFLREY